MSKPVRVMNPMSLQQARIGDSNATGSRMPAPEDPPRRNTFISALRDHWPEYLIEAWALGTFMISAAVFTALLEYPGSSVHQVIPNEFSRRSLIGLAMGF